jgi:hypothetical protein
MCNQPILVASLQCKFYVVSIKRSIIIVLQTGTAALDLGISDENRLVKLCFPILYRPKYFYDFNWDFRFLRNFSGENNKSQCKCISLPVIISYNYACKCTSCSSYSSLQLLLQYICRIQYNLDYVTTCFIIHLVN